MANMEQFEKWYEKWKSVNGYYDMADIVRLYTRDAWQASTELSEKKIAELEARNKELVEALGLALSTISSYSHFNPNSAFKSALAIGRKALADQPTKGEVK